MKHFAHLFLLLACSMLLSTSAWSHGFHEPTNTYSQLKFEQNQGHYHTNAQYRANLQGGRVYLEAERFTFDFYQYDPLNTSHHQLPIGGHAYYVNFIGANHQAELKTKGKWDTYNNYFLGSDPSKWASGVNLFQEVHYQKLYPGIDLEVYSENTDFKYDFRVEAGADPRLIRLEYEGSDGMCIRDGDLIIQTSAGEIIEFKPFAYQRINEQTLSVKCEYSLEGNEVVFRLEDGYNSDYELVIDPKLTFSTYSGSTADNWGYTATYDPQGNLYGGGIAFDPGYPTTPGAYDTSFNGGNVDIAITKFDNEGSIQIYSTYIGGNNSELPHSLIVNSNGELVIYGTSGSANFPTTPGAYDGSFNGGNNLSPTNVTFNNGSDIIVAVLSTSGDNLIGATFLGGSGNDGMNNNGNFGDLHYNYGDHARGEVIIDEDNNIYIASCTRSNDFPATPGSFQTGYGGSQDACISKFNPNLTSLLWSTYLGGSDDDASYSLKLDADNNIFTCGGTTGNDFPNLGTGWINNYNGGQADGFVANISADGTTLIESSFIGTSQYDQAYFIELDLDQNVYLYGQSRGNYPVSPGVYSDPGSKQFIQKLNHDLDASLISTVFGSGSSQIDISPTAFLVDVCNRIYVAGWGGSTGDQPGNTNGMTTTNTPDTYQTSTDGSDFYLMVLDADASALLYATYLGGNNLGEHVDGGTSRFDKEGVVYHAVCAGCGGSDDFPTTQGAYSQDNGSNNCNLGVFKFDFEPQNVKAAADIAPSGVGCDPFVVNFTNASENATHHWWDFGDGSPNATEAEPTHIFTTDGLVDSFTVTYVAIDSFQCVTTDTVLLEIIAVDPEQIQADFTYVIDSCTLEVTFTNQSFIPPQLGNLYTTFWDFDDTFLSFDEDPVHIYTAPGMYDVQLILTAPSPCDINDTILQTIEIVTPYDVEADFIPPTDGCAPIEVNLTSTFVAANYAWDWGDNTTSTGQQATHTYNDAGNYTIQLIVSDPMSCNLSDTISVDIEVLEVLNYTAGFSFPVGECFDQSIQFTNTSIFDGLVSDYSIDWNFGNNETSSDLNPSITYDAPGIYDVQLIIEGPSPCEYMDTVLQQVEVLSIIQADFLPPENSCQPLSVELSSIYPAAIYEWDMGDGTILNDSSITHQYLEAGNYNIQLTVSDPSSCTLMDAISYPVDVYVQPQANFDFTPEVIDIGMDVIFTNNSTPNVNYTWDMGDGSIYSEYNITYQYTAEGEFEVCLMAIDQSENCQDVFCADLAVFSPYVVGIANAFTPNSDGSNDEVTVNGFGIESFSFKIFNRWGELVFETTDQAIGWNGEYRGNPQEADVYVYVLDAIVAGGRPYFQEGNITLIR